MVFKYLIKNLIKMEVLFKILEIFYHKILLLVLVIKFLIEKQHIKLVKQHIKEIGV